MFSSVDNPVKKINLENTDLSKLYLYKFINIEYFLQWINNAHIRIDKIEKWDDVYELFLFKQEFEKGGNLIDVWSEALSFYGQSWTASRESNAMWRIYSPDNLSVRIKTTAQHLIDAIEKSASTAGRATYVGKVKYQTKKQIEADIQTYYSQNIFDEKVLAESLFVKRENFSYENEFRIVQKLPSIVEKEGKNVLAEIPQCLYIDASMSDFVLEVAFDSRLSDDMYNFFKSALQLKLPNVRIQKSTLATIKKKRYKI